MRRATASPGHDPRLGLYFYPRSPCGERPTRPWPMRSWPDFYPRSPCGERPRGQLPTTQPPNFYPRSPCGERRSTELTFPGFGIFLSTLSLRRATAGAKATENATWNFYPRSPCGERRICDYRRRDPGHFYPRSPCGERLAAVVYSLDVVLFLSTLSLRRATDIRRPARRSWAISIHALLAESDA